MQPHFHNEHSVILRVLVHCHIINLYCEVRHLDHHVVYDGDVLFINFFDASDEEGHNDDGQNVKDHNNLRNTLLVYHTSHKRNFDFVLLTCHNQQQVITSNVFIEKPIHALIRNFICNV